MFKIPEDVKITLVESEYNSDSELEEIKTTEEMLYGLWQADLFSLYRKYYMSNLEVVDESIRRYTETNDEYDWGEYPQYLEKKWIDLFMEKENKLDLIKIMKKYGRNYKEYLC